jgi:hypothetical protein
MNFSYSGFTVNNLFFVNNTVYAGSHGAGYGLIIPGDAFNNLTINNNIFQGFATRPVEITGSSKDYLLIQNNIYYGNGSNASNVTGTPTHYTNSGNLTSNPLFNTAGSDFHLQAGSPAINAGINESLTLDYGGNSVGNPPEIGAYEYGSTKTALAYESYLKGDTTPSLLESTYDSSKVKIASAVSAEGKKITIYPNPASNYINVSVDEPLIENEIIRIFNISGKIVTEENLPSGIKDIQIPINLKPGLYIVQIGSGKIILYTQKLIVCN